MFGIETLRQLSEDLLVRRPLVQVEYLYTH